MTGVHVTITTLRQDPSPDLQMMGITGCIIILRVPRAMDEAHLALDDRALENPVVSFHHQSERCFLAGWLAGLLACLLVWNHSP
ncbi:hypothetical protein MUK42_19660 [Musa troglodytarum]|uniref:Uncharacterized protein n=1 Tax=Musa troglodytarum TaxID=320322 RepID=A0A9E7K7J7_9LILI|nr:hypothetical protein MUK42_19660 [Musa troglodytarum]